MSPKLQAINTSHPSSKAHLLKLPHDGQKGEIYFVLSDMTTSIQRSAGVEIRQALGPIALTIC